jgi:DNA invertase Pin-like site-specific DNA recombinase
MKLGDLDLNDIIDALGMVRSDWIKIQKEENRRLTDADRVTVCVLAALEQALRRLASTQQARGVTQQAEQRIEIIGSHPFDKTVLDGLAKALDDGGPVDG